MHQIQFVRLKADESSQSRFWSDSPAPATE